MMRIARFLIAYGIVSVLGVLVAIFLAQNTQVERLTFFGRDVSTSLAWIMLAATVAGFLFALLLLLPGRIAATMHIWSLRKETRQLDEELVWQSERHDELLEHHERLLDGHDRLLSVYHRARGELDEAIKERDALKIHLDKANDALAAQQKVAVRREIIIPAPPRQTSESTPTAPRLRAAAKAPAKAPAKIPAAVRLDEPEDVREEAPAPQVAPPVSSAPASEPLSAPLVDVQPARALVVDDVDREAVSAEPEPVHTGPSFGEALAAGLQRRASQLDDWRQASGAWFKNVDDQARHRVERTGAQMRQLGSSMWGQLKERLGGVGAHGDERRRVSPLTHPK